MHFENLLEAVYRTEGSESKSHESQNEWDWFSDNLSPPLLAPDSRWDPLGPVSDTFPGRLPPERVSLGKLTGTSAGGVWPVGEAKRRSFQEPGPGAHTSQTRPRALPGQSGGPRAQESRWV